MNPNARKTIIASALLATLVGSYLQVSKDARELAAPKVLSDEAKRSASTSSEIPMRSTADQAALTSTEADTNMPQNPKIQASKDASREASLATQ